MFCIDDHIYYHKAVHCHKYDTSRVRYTITDADALRLAVQVSLHVGALSSSGIVFSQYSLVQSGPKTASWNVFAISQQTSK